jgi:hypothetical protein
MVVIGRQRRADAVAVKQFAADAGVLAGDQVGAGQRLQRPQRHVAEIADRGGDDIEPALDLRRLDRLAAKKVMPMWAAAHRRHSSAGPGPRHGDCEFIILFI